MLKDAERKKLTFLKQLVVDQNKDISREEVRWLIERLCTLFSKPDEFQFPEYAALVERREPPYAYALRRILKPNWMWSLDLPENSLATGAELISFHTTTDGQSAFLVVRPWIRVQVDAKDGLIEQVRACSLDLSIDGVKVLVDAPVDDFLTAQDGVGLRGISPEIYLTREMRLFPAVELSEDHKALPDSPIGVFVPNNNLIKLVIKGPSGHKNDPIKLVAGLTAMEYTTKPGGGGADLLIPKDFWKKDA